MNNKNLKPALKSIIQLIVALFVINIIGNLFYFLTNNDSGSFSIKYSNFVVYFNDKIEFNVFNLQYIPFIVLIFSIILYRNFNKNKINQSI